MPFGLTAQEALAVDCNAIDRAASVLTIDGACLRQIPIDDGLAHSLQAMGSNAEGPMFVRPDGTTPSAADFTTDLLLAAHDAGLGRPSEVSIEVLRHTYAAYLARQGIRMSDLAKLLGRLSTSEATLYSGLAPSGVRLSLSQVERVIPAARATRSP